MAATVTSLSLRRSTGPDRPPAPPPRRPFLDNPRHILSGIVVLVGLLVAILTVANRSPGFSPDFLTEFVLYALSAADLRRRYAGKRFSLAMLSACVKNAVQHHDEAKLLKPFADDFVGYEEPHDLYEEVLEPGWPYLPADGALGEMALSIGKSVYLYRKGVDGVVDISPFSCMNGIVSEGVYHALAADCDDIPIRNFYFDATSSNMDRDLDIFMELAANYRKRKKAVRRWPAYFQD